MSPALEVAIVTAALAVVVQIIGGVTWLVRLESKIALQKQDSEAMKTAMADAGQALREQFKAVHDEIEKVKTVVERQSLAHSEMGQTLARVDERITFMTNMMAEHFKPAPAQARPRVVRAKA